MKKKQETVVSQKKEKNFDLKSDAIDRLAGGGEAPRYSPEELNRYRSRKGIRIPELLKVVLIKGWFSGAVCFFFLWGLGSYLPNMLDMLFVLAVAHGMVTDLLVNNTLRFIEKTPGANHKWMLVSRKGVVGFFLNILYGFVIVLCVYMFYNVINYCVAGITGDMQNVALGVEPVLFGLFCMGFDMLFVGMKALLKKIIRDAQETVERARTDGRDAAE